MRTSIAAPYMLSRAGPCSLGIPARHHERHPAAHLSLFQLLAVASRRSIDDPLATCQRPVSNRPPLQPTGSPRSIFISRNAENTALARAPLFLSGPTPNPHDSLTDGPNYQVCTHGAESASLSNPLSFDVVTRIIRLFSSIQSTDPIIQFQPAIVAEEAKP